MHESNEKCKLFNTTRQEVPWLKTRGGIAIPLLTEDTLAFFCEVWHMCSMKQTLTTKLKLQTTPEQFAALRATQLAYRDALNFVSRHAFAHGKMSNQVRLQRDTY